MYLKLKKEYGNKRISNQFVADNLPFQITAQQIGNILAMSGVKIRTQRQIANGG